MNRYIRGLAAAMVLGLTACAGGPWSSVPKGEPLPPTEAPTAIPLDTEGTKPARGPCPNLAKCAAVLHDVVAREWIMPPMAARTRLKTTLLVDVKPDGLVRSVKVTQGSGNAAYDNSAIRAVEQAQPFVELRGLAEVKAQGGTELQFVFVPR